MPCQGLLRGALEDGTRGAGVDRQQQVIEQHALALKVGRRDARLLVDDRDRYERSAEGQELLDFRLECCSVAAVEQHHRRPLRLPLADELGGTVELARVATTRCRGERRPQSVVRGHNQQ